MTEKNIEHFFVEHEGTENPALIYFEGPNRKAIARLNPKEIFFHDKGAIKYAKIDFVEIKNNSNETAFTVFVCENKNWNETQKRKHPIRWKLNLISKSEPFSRVLGKTIDKPSIDKLISFFTEKGVEIRHN